MIAHEKMTSSTLGRMRRPFQRNIGLMTLFASIPILTNDVFRFLGAKLAGDAENV